MGKRLSDERISAFREEGYVNAVPVFSSAECAQFRAQVEAFEAARPADVHWAFDIKANLLFPWVYELSRHPALLDLIEDLIGPDLLLTNSIFRIKEPGASTHYGWHQDSARIRVEPRFVIAYIALSEATPDNGCLRVIPGSQHEVQSFGLVSYADRQVARVKNVDETEAVDLVLAPGEVAVFDCNTVHGSGPNRSGGRRIALLNDYSRPDARQDVGQGSGQLMRGRDGFGLIAPEPVPVGDCTEVEAAARRQILNAYPENVLMGPLAPGAVPSFADADRAS